MKTSLHWLSDFLPGELDAGALADALTHGGLPVENIESHGGDAVIDVEVTSNRGDCLSHVGVARELAALMNRAFRPPASGGATSSAHEAMSATRAAFPAGAEAAPNSGDATSPSPAISGSTAPLAGVRVDIESPSLCPHYTARLIRGVKIGPSPDWMARRLAAIGVRSINNVVDVTNYVMFEVGQPLHAFDFAKISGGKIVVREALAGEKLISIDGHERALSPGMLVIADALRPVALAGVMGGRDSEVSDATVDVLLESARFDPLSVRKTARTLAMKSDSSYRFERGIDPTLPVRAGLRAAELILQTAGGTLVPGVAEAGATGWQPKTISLRLARVKQVLGIELPTAEMLAALNRLGLSPVLHGDRIDVTSASWRLDVGREIDLVEEVARVIGYDRIPMREEISIRLAPPEPTIQTIDAIRDTLVAAGYFEAVTFSFVSDLLADDFTPTLGGASAALPRTDPAVRKADGRLRPSLLPGLLESVRFNETAGTNNARLFEIGSTFVNDAAGNVDERRKLGLVGGESLRDVRGVVETILSRLDAERSINIVPDARAGFGKSACGRIEWNGTPVGFLGVIDRATAEKLSLRGRPAAAEIELGPLLGGARHVPTLKPLPRFPAVRRDLSLVVAESVRFEKLANVIRGVNPQFLEDVEYVTAYRGKPLEPGTKSVTITLVFRSPTDTLTGEQVESSVKPVIAAAKDKLSATLRA
jgi:phenylalanyl-tRNA synthetase beta chain